MDPVIETIRENAEHSGDAYAQPLPDAPAWEWALVEIFGHRSHAGRTREEERFGAKMLRIDVPIDGDPGAKGWRTHWYGGSSIFSYALTDEDSVMRANKPYERASPYRLPKPQYKYPEAEEGDF